MTDQVIVTESSLSLKQREGKVWSWSCSSELSQIEVNVCIGSGVCV